MAAPLCRAERGPATSIPYATSSGRSVARFRPYSTKIHATRMLNRRRRFALLCCAPIGSRRRDLRPRPTLRNERTSTRRAASFGASDSKVARRLVKRGIACFGPTTRKKESRRTSRDDEDRLGGEGARVGVASLDDTIVCVPTCRYVLHSRAETTHSLGRARGSQGSLRPQTDICMYTGWNTVLLSCRCN